VQREPLIGKEIAEHVEDGGIVINHKDSSRVVCR